MPLDPDSLFKINIQTDADIIALKQECSDNTKILDLKEIILAERNYTDSSIIVLQYEGITMENDKTLRDYNIIDSDHIIKLSFNFRDSTHNHDRGASDHLQNNNGVNSNYQTVLIPSYLRQPELNCCEKFKHEIRGLYQDAVTEFRENTCRCSCITVFILFFIGYLGTTIGNSVAFVNQYQIYNEYIQTPTNNINVTTPVDALNYYCNDKANEFNRDISRDLLDGASINITFAVLSFLAAPVLFLMVFIDSINGCGCISEFNFCGAVILFMYCGIFWLGTIVFYVLSLVYNSIILWINITNIQNYCDSQTDFYQQMIGKWSIWSYINTIIGYILLPCIYCLITVIIKYE